MWTLSDAVKRENFREDLYYRLNVVHITVPALRERREDLAELAQAFVSSYAAKHGRAVSACIAEALALLSEYEFPGNVRELANTIERAVIVSSGQRIDVDDLPESIRATVRVQRRRGSRSRWLKLRRNMSRRFWPPAKVNKTEAARILGISRKNLYEKLARQHEG